MTHPEPKPDPAAVQAFVALAGGAAWRKRMADLGARLQPGSLSSRAMQQRHALELILARLADRSAGTVRNALAAGRIRPDALGFSTPGRGAMPLFRRDRLPELAASILRAN